MVRWFKLICVPLFVFLVSCRNKQVESLPESIPQIHQFDSFYVQFHSDSFFQLSHIIFPLEGQPEESDTVVLNETYYWPKESWMMHRIFNASDTNYVRSFQIVDSTLLRETIYHRFSTYKMERRYSWMEDGWYLIYYAPMRQPARIQIN